MPNNKIVEQLNSDIMDNNVCDNKTYPLISFIVPAYNVANEIEDCIKSIINAFDNANKNEYEIVVVNDGSTDNTGEILEQFKNFSNINIISKSNEGLSAARNDGINQSKGKYLSFIDGDDYVISQTAEILIPQLINDYDIVINDYYDDKKGILSKANILNKINSKSDEKKLVYFLKYTPKSIVQHYVVKRDLLINNNLFFIKGVLHEDLDWGMRISDLMFKNKLSVIYNSENPWYCYRRNRDGSIMSVKRSWKNTFSVISMAINLHKELANKYLIKQTTISLYSQLKGYYKPTNPKEKIEEIASLANNNKYIFKSYKPKYFPFYLCLKIFGFKWTMKLFKIFI